MPKKKYTAEFKTKVILTIIQGDKEFNAICADFNLHPSMVRKWKQEFLQNAHRAFDSDSEMKAGKPKEKEWLDAHSSGSSHWRVVPFKWCFRQIGTSLMKQSFDERNQ